MTLDDVRDALRAACAPYVTKQSPLGLRSWCRVHGVASTHASEFLNGHRGPSGDLLDALNLEWSIRRKDESL